MRPGLLGIPSRHAANVYARRHTIDASPWECMVEAIKRMLGRGGPKVPAIGLGCMVLSGTYGPAEEKESLATLDRALEVGCNFWDTADVYGRGHNEQLVGRALKGRREIGRASCREREWSQVVAPAQDPIATGTQQ